MRTIQDHHFVDHFYHLQYVHFHEMLSLDETVQVKIDFEKFVTHHGIQIEK